MKTLIYAIVGMVVCLSTLARAMPTPVAEGPVCLARLTSPQGYVVRVNLVMVFELERTLGTPAGLVTNSEPPITILRVPGNQYEVLETPRTIEHMMKSCAFSLGRK